MTKKQAGIRPGDSTTNQLIDFVNKIHLSYDNKKPLTVKAVFLDISKACFMRPFVYMCICCGVVSCVHMWQTSH